MSGEESLAVVQQARRSTPAPYRESGGSFIPDGLVVRNPPQARGLNESTRGITNYVDQGDE